MLVLTKSFRILWLWLLGILLRILGTFMFVNKQALKSYRYRAYEIFSSIVPWATKLFSKNLNLLPFPTGPSSYMINVRSQNILYWDARIEDRRNLKSRSSLQRCSLKKGVLRNFAKFTGNHLGQSLFFDKTAGLSRATLLKRRLWHRCFLVIFVKFLRAPF